MWLTVAILCLVVGTYIFISKPQAPSDSTFGVLGESSHGGVYQRQYRLANGQTVTLTISAGQNGYLFILGSRGKEILSVTEKDPSNLLSWVFSPNTHYSEPTVETLPSREMLISFVDSVVLRWNDADSLKEYIRQRVSSYPS